MEGIGSQGGPETPPATPESTPPPAKETTPNKEEEFVGVMTSLEALNESGKHVVDVIHEDKERGLPRAVVIPARIELDGDDHKGTVFVTKSGVFIDFGENDTGMLDQNLETAELWEKEAGSGALRKKWDRLDSWTVIDDEVRNNKILKGKDNGDVMIERLVKRYRNPERHFNRATPAQLKAAKDRAVEFAPISSPEASPSDYINALK